MNGGRGFCAYAYYGNPKFNIFGNNGEPWNGRDPLELTDDFFHFRKQLQHHATTNNESMLLHNNSGPVDTHAPEWPRCQDIEEELRSCCNIELYSMGKNDFLCHVVTELVDYNGVRNKLPGWRNCILDNAFVRIVGPASRRAAHKVDSW
jgi:hypothetical protein